MPFTLTVGVGTLFHKENNDPHIIDFGAVNTNIVFGKFTLTGPNLTIFAGGSEHNFKTIAILPSPPYSKGDIKVGNGVWIGAGVTIFTGVTIGDGAVIGACSVVSKDIPPYAIAVGNPIRVIGYRFRPDQIEKLLKVKWWDWDAKRLAEDAPLLFSENLDLLFIRCGL
jgi:acetyltransferase-like isoleucine patch superfamily enzyme